MAGHVLLAGDWNEPPTATGRYSPHWIARKAHLGIYAPPKPGKHGLIDYALSSVPITGMHRLQGGGSDHDFIRFMVNHGDPITGRVYRLHGAIWNVERDRDAKRRYVLRDYLEQRTAPSERLDFIMLQEAKQYHPLLGNLATGWHLTTSPKPGACNLAILTAPHVGLSHRRVEQISPGGWFTEAGEEHAPVYAVGLKLDGWLTVVDVHEPPAVDWRDGGMVGPARRVIARQSSARGLVSIAREVTQ